MCYTNAIELMAKSAAVDFAALDDEDNTQVRAKIIVWEGVVIGMLHGCEEQPACLT
jgi:hypothetical protein